MIRKILSITVLFFLTSYTLAEPLRYCTAQESSQDPEISYEEAIRRLDLFMQKIEELRSHIDRSQFDLEALLDKIGYEAEDIIRFVKDEIAFEQYPGLLRGAQGTLMSRAGNALDQSVLLATLLKDAGYDARIQRGKISSTDAERLLAQMDAQRQARPVSGNLDSMADILRKLGEEVQGLSRAEIAKRVEAIVSVPVPSNQPPPDAFQEQVDLILGVLEEKGISLGDPQTGLDLIDEARDYFWVDHKALAAESWRAAHPAFGNTQAPAQLAAVATFRSEIPLQLQHRVRFQAFIEQRTGESRRKRPLMSPWERPAANLHCKTLTFGTGPSRLSSFDDLTRLPEILADSSLFLPFFGGVLPEGANGFDRYGNTFPPDALALGGAGELIATVGSRGQMAVSALRGLGRSDEGVPSAGQSITAYWLEFILIAPGGEETSIRRDILGPNSEGEISGDGTAPQLWSQLLAANTFSVATGSVPDAYLLDRVMEELSASRSLVEEILRAFADSNESREWQLGKVRAPEPVHLPQLFALFDAVNGESGPYRAAPSVVSHRVGLLSPEENYELIDVVSSSRRSLHYRPSDARQAAVELLRQGVWETLTEGAVLMGPKSSQTPIESTLTVLERAQALGTPLQLLLPGDPASSFESLGGPLTERELARDLSAGFVLIVPERLSDGESAGWWRIKPSTGETLGMLQGAGGADIVFYITAIGIMLGGFLAMWGLLDCLKMQSRFGRGSKMCCMKNALAGFAAGVVTGAVVGFIGAAIFKSFVAGALIGLYVNDILWGFVAFGKGWPQVCDPLAFD